MSRKNNFYISIKVEYQAPVKLTPAEFEKYADHYLSNARRGYVYSIPLSTWTKVFRHFKNRIF